MKKLISICLCVLWMDGYSAPINPNKCYARADKYRQSGCQQTVHDNIVARRQKVLIYKEASPCNKKHQHYNYRDTTCVSTGKCPSGQYWNKKLSTCVTIPYFRSYPAQYFPYNS